jgi:chemotaxis methyl-accepting protein methylase
MIYFKPEIKAAVYHRFYRALAEDGTLFIGHSETMKRVYEKFTPLYFDEAVVYKKALDQGKENNDF